VSYPTAIQPLVIEDQEDPKEAYERIFTTIAAEYTQLAFPAAPPLFAFSHEEGIQHLASSRMFHIVILDLRLPRTKRLPPPDGVDLGLDLLNKARERNTFPIPSLLIVSGHIGKTEQERIHQTLRDDFYYGRMFAKGPDLDLLEKEIRHAYAEAIRYCSVGIHIRDSETAQYPTLSPDEDDLLRRCVLKTAGTVGLDLSWWDAELHGIEPVAWTKVLVGRFLLEQGRGASRPQFFKLFPGGLATHTYESARHLERKLSHIKVTSTVNRNSRALLVTEKVGSHLPRPISVEEFLKTPTSAESIRSIVRQIAKQLHDLGDTSPQSAAVNKLLWKSHDLGAIKRQWAANHGSTLTHYGALDPMSLFENLLTNDERIRFDEQSLVHGDLHLRNVAIDSAGDIPEAYTFDSASAVGRCPKGRDLALLEISAIIHQDLPPEQITSVLLPLLYGRSFVPEAPREASSIHVLNTLRMVSHLREVIVDTGMDKSFYALMVLDQSMIQLAGLEFGSPNRIRHPQVIVHLVAAVSQWYHSLLNV
jgi:CheY-like chemotaxis protein